MQSRLRRKYSFLQENEEAFPSEAREVKKIESTEAKVFEGAGASSANVYATLIIGKNAYGKTAITGGGLETIIKSNEQAGGPLNQYATVGWKATKTAERLIEEYMIRIESGCSLG